jgi:ATP-GRASP peptide maturase of grasp-with-spasm system
MILILSDENDTSTNHVIDWLIYYKAGYVRINLETPVIIKNITINNEELSILVEINKHIFDLCKFTAYWYRRGKISIRRMVNFKLIENPLLLKGIQHHLSDELSNVEGLMYYILNQIPRKINKFSDARYSNKLINLHKAREVGLDIPSSVIIDNKQELEEFNQKNNSQIITKAIKEGLGPYYRQTPYLSYTEEVVNEDIEKSTSNFFPSLFQNKIEKVYEIRVFYLVDKIYSVAIFSQRKKRTAIDYRHYDLANPNRFVPYSLPKEIEEKIHQFMLLIKMTSGSLDFIVTKDGRFIFLEINPVGQYGGMVSAPGNYSLDKKIAQYLIGKE